MILKLITLIGTTFALCTSAAEQNTKINEAKQLDIAERLEYIGISACEEDKHVWGSSPIIGEDGKVHLFSARYAGGFNRGWRSDSHIAHYVADKPEGPFKFVEVVYKGEYSKEGQWNYFGIHNPTIRKVDGKYALFFIANSNKGGTTKPSNQTIGMMTAPSLTGPWSKPKQMLKPSEDENHWTYKSPKGVNNPAFLKGPDGRYYLYYKSAESKYGVAIADKLEGPYLHHPESVTKNDKIIEDAYAFMYKGNFCLLTTDNHGTIERGGGLLWTSSDGISFGKPVQGYKNLQKYISEETVKQARHIYGGMKTPKLVRPQLLLIDGEPAYLYGPSGSSLRGKEFTENHVLRITKKAIEKEKVIEKEK